MSAQPEGEVDALVAEARKAAEWLHDEPENAHLGDYVELIRRLASALSSRRALSREEVARAVQEGFLKRQTWEEIADAILSRVEGKNQ